MHVNSIEINPISAEQISPNFLAMTFIESRTRHAPVPQESIINPTRPTTAAFAGRLAVLAKS